jgi:predicted MPP superfamily phosphohydrolase
VRVSFITMFLAVLALGNLYAGWRVIARWPWGAQHPALAYGIVLIVFLLQLVGPFGDRLWFPRWRNELGLGALAEALDWISYTTLGAVSTLILVAFATDIVTIIWKMVAPPADLVNFNRRTVLAMAAASLGATTLGVAQAKIGLVVKQVQIPLKDLPARFEGFTIAQISDLHVGPTIRRGFVQRVVDEVKALNADAIALTGDFSDGSVADLAEHMAPIGQLKAPHGIYFITGNHEYFWDPEGWIGYFRQIGARVLLNEHEVIRRDDDAILLAGVTDYSTRFGRGTHASSAARALDGAPEGLTKIMLAHQPASYEDTQAAGFDLQLSGHTHAGQYFPFTLLIGFFQRYTGGLNRYRNMWIYVNRGTGYWGPPLRTANAPEITLVKLVRA